MVFDDVLQRNLACRHYSGMLIASSMITPKRVHRADNSQFLGVLIKEFIQTRWMTTSKRVQDRSSQKRVHDLEIATERWKVFSKVMFIAELLRREPQEGIQLRRMERYKKEINLKAPYTISDFVKKSPNLFALYEDRKDEAWCRLTELATHLMDEEDELLESHQSKAVECITRMLMMSVDKRLRLDKILHFRRDFGLPWCLKEGWIHKFPEHFRMVKMDGVEHLELVSWNPDWAITELEKMVGGLKVGEAPLPSPGVLCLPFPMKYPPRFKKAYKIGGKIEHFQKLPYLSPYADAHGLSAGSKEFDKRAIAVMHELLSFSIEKRLVTDHLTHFRHEFVMPQKLMRLLLKHFGIFYVSERGKRFHVFLNEAYEGSELIDKCPLVLWKERILGLTNYRGRKRGIKKHDRVLDIEGQSSFEGHISIPASDIDGDAYALEDGMFFDDSEMEGGF